MAFNILGQPAKDQIAVVYTAFFGRAPDPPGRTFWDGEFSQGAAQGKSAKQLLADIASSFGSDDEAKDTYSFLRDPQNGDIDTFINSIYQNLFSRPPDAAGLQFWRGEIQTALSKGGFVGDAIVDIVSGAQGDDITVLENKIAVGNAYADAYSSRQRGAEWTKPDDLSDATTVVSNTAKANKAAQIAEARNKALGDLGLNRAPAAQDITVAGNEDTTINGTIPINDADGDNLTINQTMAPRNGSVSVNPDGSFAYTPAANFFGSDSFEVTALDGRGGSDTATVTINVSDVVDPSQTILLTAGADTESGGAGDDTFRGTAVGDLGAGDNLNGKFGHDTVDAKLQAVNGGSTITPTLDGIERLELERVDIQGGSPGSATLDLAGAPGLTEIALDLPTPNTGNLPAQTITLASVGTDTDVVVAGDGTSSGNVRTDKLNLVLDDLTAADDNFAMTLRNIAERPTLVVDDDKTPADDADDMETFTLTIAADSDFEGIRVPDAETLETKGGGNLDMTFLTDATAGSSLTSWTHSGGGHVTIENAILALDTVEVTGNGSLDILMQNDGDGRSFTGGGGDDILRLTDDFVPSNDTIDMGGGRDVLAIQTGFDAPAASDPALPSVEAVALFDEYEETRFSNGTQSATINTLGFTDAVDLTGTGVQRAEIWSDERDFELTGDLTRVDIPASGVKDGVISSSADRLELVEVEDERFGDRINANHKLDVSNVETLAVSGEDFSFGNDRISFDSLKTSSVKTLEATGDEEVWIRGLDAPDLTAIDASALNNFAFIKEASGTGASEALTVTGSDQIDNFHFTRSTGVTVDAGGGADLVTGGAGNDTLRGGANGDDLVGNGGADKLEGGAAADTLNGGEDDNAADILTGGAGVDSFNFEDSFFPASTIGDPTPPDRTDTLTDWESGESLHFTDRPSRSDDAWNGLDVDGDDTVDFVLTSANGASPSTQDEVIAVSGADSLAESDVAAEIPTTSDGAWSSGDQRLIVATDGAEVAIYHFVASDGSIFGTGSPDDQVDAFEMDQIAYFENEQNILGVLDAITYDAA